MSALKIPAAIFRVGHIRSTPHALEYLTHEDICRGLQRHQAGDWGDLPDDDRAANDQALVQGTRILSAYCSDSGVKFWIITEADRSATTVLLPEDY